MRRIFLMLLSVFFSLGLHAQSNNTCLSGLRTTLDDLRVTAGRIADGIEDSAKAWNASNSMVPGALKTADSIYEKMKEIKTLVEEITSVSYLVKVVAASATVAVAIGVSFGAGFVGIRYAINRYHKTEPMDQPMTP